MKKFKGILLELFTKANSQVIELVEIKNAIDNELSGIKLSMEQILTYLKSMESENKIMLVEDSVYLI